MYRILVVDDEDKIRALIRKYAEFEGHTVREAADGMEAGRICREHPDDFDIIIMDVMMPEPLPEDHPLWSAKNMIITPHVSGNMTLGYTCDLNVEMFCRDLANYAAGRPLNGLVDRARGY